MTLTDPFVVHRPAGELPAWRVVAGGDRTGGQVLFGEACLPARTLGPPRHVHTYEDEALLVVSGVLTVQIGDDIHEAGPGAVVWMPRGIPHHFANNGDELVRGFGVTTPAGIERFFTERDQYLASLTGSPDMAYLLELNARFGIRPA